MLLDVGSTPTVSIKKAVRDRFPGALAGWDPTSPVFSKNDPAIHHSQRTGEYHSRQSRHNGAFYSRLCRQQIRLLARPYLAEEEGLFFIGTEVFQGIFDEG